MHPYDCAGNALKVLAEHRIGSARCKCPLCGQIVPITATGYPAPHQRRIPSYEWKRRRWQR